MVKLLDGTANTVKISVQFITQHSGVYAKISLNEKEYLSGVVTSNETTFDMPLADVTALKAKGDDEAFIRFYDSFDSEIAICRAMFTVVEDPREAVGFDTVYATIGDVGGDTSSSKYKAKYIYDKQDRKWHEIFVHTDAETGDKTVEVAQTGIN